MDNQQTVTYLEIITALTSLEVIAKRGFKDQKLARKIASMLIWARRKLKEFEESRKVLLNAHAEKNEDGSVIYNRIKDEETGEFKDNPNDIKVKNLDDWIEAFQGLQNQEINTNGTKITEAELLTCSVPPEPIVYANLGPFLVWDD
jgi:hypothetical protein